MSELSRLISRFWPLVLICAGAYLFWCDRVRIQRVEYVTGLVERPASVDSAEKKSLTGYAGGRADPDRSRPE